MHLLGNPNVGKSTIFNSLTGMHQHTGNWPGKTVSNAAGTCDFLGNKFLFVDIPGTYSIMSNSEEEEIARDYICFGNPDATIVVVDATCLERNLNLVFQIMELTNNVIVCVNLLDEAKKKGIDVDLNKLSMELGVHVVGTIARKKKTLNNLLNTVYNVCTKRSSSIPNKIKYSDIIEDCVTSVKQDLPNSLFVNNNYILRWISLKLIDGEKCILNSIEKHLNVSLINNKKLTQKVNMVRSKLHDNNIDSSNFKDEIVSSIMQRAEKICTNVCTFKNKNYSQRDRNIDKILTSKKFGIPIMILFLGIIFWITIIGANYPSQILFNMFAFLQTKLVWLLNYINCPSWLNDLLVLRYIPNFNMGCSSYAPSNGSFLPFIYFSGRFGVFA